MIGIYKITTPLNELYVGKSINLERRIKEHKTTSNTNYRIHRSIKKYGLENHSFEIIEECDVKVLDEREKYWIKNLCKNNIMININYVDFIFKENEREVNIKKIENQIQFTFKLYPNIVCLNDGLLYQLEHCPKKRTKTFRKLTYNEKRKAYYINGQLVTKNRLTTLRINSGK